MNDQPPSINFDEDINRRLVPALKTHAVVLGENGSELFPAGVADMDFKVALPILEAMQKRLDHGVFGYETVPDGLMPAVVNWLRNRHGWDVDENQILRAPNVLNGLALAVSLFTNEGDGIIVQPPVFFDFFEIIEQNQRRLAVNPLLLNDGVYEIDFEGLADIASGSRNKILFLCNPHNPVGRVWRRDELVKIGEICNRHNVLVVADEIHGDITFPEYKFYPYSSLGSKFSDNAITFFSPAKSFNIAGCCSAFTVISNDDRRKAFQVENSRLTVNKNNAFSSVAMEAAYAKGEGWLDEVIEYLQGNLELVRTKLLEIPGISLIEPHGTFLVWLDFRSLGLSSDELTVFLRKKAKWAVIRGEAFGPEGIGFARLNIACPRAKLEIALDKLIRAEKLI